MRSDTINNICAIHDNLMLKNNGDVFVMYEVPKKIINGIDTKQQESFKNLTQSCLGELSSYKDFAINMIPLTFDLVKMYGKLSEDFAPDTEDLAWYVLDESYKRLTNSVDAIFEQRWYLTLPLKSLHITFSKQEAVKSSFNYLAKRVYEPFSGKVSYDENWYESYQPYLDTLESKLKPLQVKPLTTEQTEFINTLQYLRGTHFNYDYEVSATHNNIDNLDDTTITWENNNILTLHNGINTSYMALLPVAYTPDNMSYLHLLPEFQSFNFPIEVMTLGSFSAKKGTFSLPSKAGRARLRQKNVLESDAEAEGITQKKKWRAKFLLDDLLEKSQDDEHLIEYLQTAIFTDTDYDALCDKMRLVMDALTRMGVELVKASADQIYLFYKTRFGEILEKSDKNFIQATTLEGFCENLFFTGRKIGQDTGFYLGRVDSHQGSWQGNREKALNASVCFAYVNPFQANKQDIEGKTTSNPHTAIIGETGGGKSFVAKYLFLYSSLLRAKILFFDPKAEMRVQFNKVLKDYEKRNIHPEIQNYIKSINFVTLDKQNKGNWGVLDPIVFLKGADAKDLALSMVNEIYPLKDKEYFHSALLDSLEKHLTLREQGHKVGMLSVFKDLEKHDLEEVQLSASLLTKMVQNSILSLCFSDGQNQAVDTDRRITILEVTGLDLPTDANTKKEDLEANQLKSLVVMYALGHYCHKFGSEDRTQETIIFMDEAWFFNTTAVGRSIIKRIKRVGRSENNFLVLITQSVDDTVNEADNTGFGTIFAFHSSAENEAEKVLKRMKIPVSESTLNWYDNMQTQGQCILHDTFGRSERITVDGLFPELNELFKTVASDMKAIA
ncbi:MAG: ATP-binding protein [Lactococcus raffinolactis]|uniref:ATP-binding protein n=1 Tax=Pseudolactococcus raffinolactis TaxID=1366 RepID=UPI0039911BEE